MRWTAFTYIYTVILSYMRSISHICMRLCTFTFWSCSSFLVAMIVSITNTAYRQALFWALHVRDFFGKDVHEAFIRPPGTSTEQPETAYRPSGESKVVKATVNVSTACVESWQLFISKHWKQCTVYKFQYSIRLEVLQKSGFRRCS